MSLSTGERLHCHQWTEPPLTDYVTDRVEDLAAQENQPSVVTSGHPVFEWTPGVPILNEDETEGEELEEAKLETEDMPCGGDLDDELFDDDDETPCAPND